MRTVKSKMSWNSIMDLGCREICLKLSLSSLMASAKLTVYCSDICQMLIYNCAFHKELHVKIRYCYQIICNDIWLFECSVTINGMYVGTAHAITLHALATHFLLHMFLPRLCILIACQYPTFFYFLKQCLCGGRPPPSHTYLKRMVLASD